MADKSLVDGVIATKPSAGGAMSTVGMVFAAQCVLTLLALAVSTPLRRSMLFTSQHSRLHGSSNPRYYQGYGNNGDRQWSRRS